MGKRDELKTRGYLSNFQIETVRRKTHRCCPTGFCYLHVQEFVRFHEVQIEFTLSWSTNICSDSSFLFSRHGYVEQLAILCLDDICKKI